MVLKSCTSTHWCLTPVTPHDERWPSFHFWCHHLCIKLTLSKFKFCRRKRSFPEFSRSSSDWWKLPSIRPWRTGHSAKIYIHFLWLARQGKKFSPATWNFAPCTLNFRENPAIQWYPEIRVIGSLETEIYMKMLKNLREKLGVKFPATTLSDSMVKITIKKIFSQTFPNWKLA